MNDEIYLLRSRNGWLLSENGYLFTLESNSDEPTVEEIIATTPANRIIEVLQSRRLNAIDFMVDSVIAPIGWQEVWAAGVTYVRSKDAREEESEDSTVYTRVYDAQRPELFFKALGTHVVGPNDAVGIRHDAVWSVPEPELTIVLNGSGEVIGFTIGNDMSSRDIEGQNPLYLPQAKVYDGSCAIGPRIWLLPEQTTWPNLTIEINISRNSQVVFGESTTTSNLRRSLAELVDYLFRCKSFPDGAYSMTGTGIVPPIDFALAEGDSVSIRIDPIGELINTVKRVGDPAKRVVSNVGIH